MLQRSMLAGHIPAAPALLQRHPMIDAVLAAAPNQHPRNSDSSMSMVAAQAAIIAHDLRFSGVPRLHGVEDDALLRIPGSDLDEPAANPTHRSGIVEEKCPRIRGIDPVC